MPPTALHQPARRLALLCALGASALALPASASAATTTFCVNVTGCPPELTTSLQTALNAAAAGPGPAKVRVGAKPDGTPHLGPFTYVQGGALDNTVEIAGEGRPVLTSAKDSSAVLALHGSSGTMVTGVDVEVPNRPGADGLVLDGTVIADAVHIRGGGNIALNRGVVASQGALLLDTSIAMKSGFGVEVAGGSANLDLMRIDAPVGVIGADTDLRIDRSRIHAGFQGVQLNRGNGGNGQFIRDGLLLARSEVTTTAANGQGVFVRDAPVLLTRVAVAGRSGAPAAGKAALELETQQADVDVFVVATVLAGYDRTMTRTATGGRISKAEITDSEWDASRDLDGPLAGPITRTRFADAAPRFVDRPGGDLRLRGGDEGIDIHPEPFGGLNANDIDARTAIDGDGDGVLKTDAGPYEYRRRAPSIDGVTADTAGIAGIPLAFGAQASDADGDAVELHWDLGDGATATGGSVGHAFAAPGTYRVTATARDDAGVTTTTSLDVAIAPAPAVQSPSGETPSGATITPSGSTGDRTAPSLTGAKLTVRRRALRGRKVRLAVTTSEAATLKLAVGGLKRTVAVPRGRSAKTIVLTRRTLRALARRRSRLTVVAVDAAGNRSAAKRLRLTIRR